MAQEIKIYTRTGDDGTTGLIGGTRVKKHDIRLEAYGTVDELNSWIGLIRAMPLQEAEIKTLERIQNILFVIGAHLASDQPASFIKEQLPCKEEDISLLEQEMDRMSETLPGLTHFILPGGGTSAAHCQVARTICRRAERRIIELAEHTEVDPGLIKYINRLSDYLFVLARKAAKDQNIPETLWIPEKK